MAQRDRRRSGGGFVRTASGKIALFHDPHAQATEATGINDGGSITGKFKADRIYQDFVRIP